jgi:hypothetical protein
MVTRSADILRHIAAVVSRPKATTQATIIRAVGEALGAWSGVLPRSSAYLLVVGTGWGGGEYRLRLVLR